MKTFKNFSQELDERCWTGYKPVPGKKPYSKGSCRKEDVEYDVEIYELEEDYDFEYTHVAVFKEENGQYIDLFIDAESDEDAAEQASLHEGIIGELQSIEEEVEEQLDEKAPAWQRKEGKSKSGGLNRKGVMSYRRANPGSKLKTAVTTKPSKLKKGSKAAKRRKSFCSRMKGMKRRLTGAKKARDPNSRINKALRKWNCR